jgi:hypothetical protein
MIESAPMLEGDNRVPKSLSKKLRRPNAYPGGEVCFKRYLDFRHFSAWCSRAVEFPTLAAKTKTRRGWGTHDL